MPILQVIVLAIVQGLAELLPVSSSAHVVVAEKLMGLDPSSPQMTLLLVMLHTGTMFAVIAYFWKQWKYTYFKNADSFKRFAVRVVWATLLTGIVGEIIKKIIEKTMFKGAPKAEIEDLFGRNEALGWSGAALAAVAGVAFMAIVLREASGLWRLHAIETLRRRGMNHPVDFDERGAGDVVRMLGGFIPVEDRRNARVASLEDGHPFPLGTGSERIADRKRGRDGGAAGCRDDAKHCSQLHARGRHHLRDRRYRFPDEYPCA